MSVDSTLGFRAPWPKPKWRIEPISAIPWLNADKIVRFWNPWLMEMKSGLFTLIWKERDHGEVLLIHQMLAQNQTFIKRRFCFEFGGIGRKFFTSNYSQPEKQLMQMFIVNNSKSFEEGIRKIAQNWSTGGVSCSITTTHDLILLWRPRKNSGSETGRFYLIHHILQILFLQTMTYSDPWTNIFEEKTRFRGGPQK